MSEAEFLHDAIALRAFTRAGTAWKLNVEILKLRVKIEATTVLRANKNMIDIITRIINYVCINEDEVMISKTHQNDVLKNDIKQQQAGTVTAQISAVSQDRKNTFLSL